MGKIIDLEQWKKEHSEWIKFLLEVKKRKEKEKQELEKNR